VAERYRQTMRTMLENVWKEEEILKSIDRAEALLADHLHERQSGASRAMDNTRQFIRSRREAIAAELEKWPVEVASQPRKPTYTVAVGSAKGSFTTAWQEKPAADPLEAGDAQVQLELDGKTIAFKQLGATAQLMQQPRFGFGFGGPGGQRGGPGRGGPPRDVLRPGSQPGDARPGDLRERGAGTQRPGAGRFGGGPFGQGEPPATVVLTGVRESDSRNLTLTLTVDPKVFAESAGKTIAVQGSISEGETGGGGFMPFGGRVVNGKLTLAKVGMNAGDAVEGEFELQIAETRGGFMDRRGGGRGGPGRRGRGDDVPADSPSRGPRDPGAPR
jgi:hypothetical protein